MSIRACFSVLARGFENCVKMTQRSSAKQLSCNLHDGANAIGAAPRNCLWYSSSTEEGETVSNDPVELVRQLGGELTNGSPPRVERATIHYTELPADFSSGPLAAEWNFYRGQ